LIEQLHERLSRLSLAREESRAVRDLTSLDVPGLWRFKARAAHVATPAGHDVTLDGEIRARTPLDVWTVPDALRVLVPEREVAISAARSEREEVRGA
jgi:diacylglycerol kinase family enzyme